MLEREIAIAELWRRMNSVSGVKYTTRNPKAPPSIDDMPTINIFELEDEVVAKTMRGGYPAYKRSLPIVLEAFITGSSESAATKELGVFLQEMRKKLYEGGTTLGGKCAEITETTQTRVLRPPAGEHTVGIGLTFEMIYIEDISRLMS